MEEKFNEMSRVLSEKELLLSFGYHAHQIIELQDGTAILDEERLRQDYIFMLKNRRIARKGGPRIG